MALSVSQTAALASILRSGMMVCSLGYPDIIASTEYISRILGEDFKDLRFREDSEDICRRHGLSDRKIPDAESFFALKGCGLHVYDIIAERGCERLCDLNQPGNLKVHNGFYDVVLDVGTIEHCFNIGAAAFNMAGLVKKGGVIIHENPFNWGNHGFYSMNPTWYHDFYSINGFKVVECKLVTRFGEVIGKPPLTQRFQYTEQECNVFAIAERVRIQPFVYPIQTKYKQAVSVAGNAGVEKVA